MFVRGDELLFKSLFQKDNTTLSAIVTLFPLSYIVFFDRSFYGGFFTLYSFLSDHLDCTLIIHLNLYSRACPIDIFSGFLCTVVVEIALFRGLLHINVARKVAAVHLMQW